MAAKVYDRAFWERTRGENPYLWSSEHWFIWEAMDQVERESVRVVSARMSRGFAVRVMTEAGERLVRVIQAAVRAKNDRDGLSPDGRRHPAWRRMVTAARRGKPFPGV